MCSPEEKDQIVINQEQLSPIIDAVQGRELLQLARSTIKIFLRDETVLDYESGSPITIHNTGVFITLWEQRPIESEKSLDAEPLLRGCIGQLKSDLPLFELVQTVAVGAATRDPRFPPLALAELETILIELTLLSPFRVVEDLREISIGRDGLLLDGFGKRGLLLPKVAVRMGWDRESFLQGVCDKARLPRNCWPGTPTLYSFTSCVFEEATKNT